MKRGGRLSPTSKKRVAELKERPEIRKRVFDRDKTCVLSPWNSLNTEGRDWGPCFGIPTVHHVLKASQGGSYTEDNLRLVCAGHNDMIEDHPKAAYAIGLVRKPWE